MSFTTFIKIFEAEHCLQNSKSEYFSSELTWNFPFPVKSRDDSEIAGDYQRDCR